MGKRLIQQRRGRGTPTYRAPSHRYKAKIEYPSYNQEAIKGMISKLLHSPGFTAPLAKIRLSTGKTFYNLASEKMVEGQEISLGREAQVIAGNILPLDKIPDGTEIYNIELQPGDGGKLVRSAGTNATIRRRVDNGVIILLPSKQEKKFNVKVRATIGRIAGAGRTDKPIVKAGKKYHMMRAKNILYPRTSPVKMNAIDHPFGGGRGKVIGKPKTPPRYAGAGRKVGLLRARRTGRRKK